MVAVGWGLEDPLVLVLWFDPIMLYVFFFFEKKSFSQAR
jgi:hypothetical protein